MSADYAAAIAYLQTPPNVCWRWADQDEVLVWQDGTTVAFRQEVVAVLERLQMNRLPPFSAVALYLAACRGKVPEAARVLGEEIPAASETGPARIIGLARRRLRLQVEEGLEQLAKLRQLPPELLAGLEGKAALAEIVFEPAIAERQTDAGPVLRGLKTLKFNDELNWVTEGGWQKDSVRDVVLLAQGLKPHSVESLRLRLKTALDEIPRPADVELPASQRAQRLIEELNRDEEFAGLARAVRELVAAIRLPRHLAQPDEMLQGGVSDISNHGPLDRLLITELAHDDLTLATRVAMNEALYLRREPPSQEPPSHLVLLMDSGVRMWGLPRIFAAAVALALAVKESHRASVSAWRALGSEVVKVDLFSRAGLIEHLAELTVGAHPGAALAALARAIETSSERSSQRAVRNDAVIITSRDALRDPEFRRTLSEATQLSGYLAIVDRDGSFALHPLPLAESRPLVEAALNLNDIFQERRSSALLVDRAADPELPAIFRARPFPFLLPVTGTIEFQTRSRGFAFAVMKDSRVMRWKPDGQRGAEQIAVGIPSGKTLCLEATENGDVLLVRWRESSRRLMIIEVKEANSTVVEVSSLPACPVAVVRRNEMLLLIEHHKAHACHPRTGRLVSAPAPADWKHHHGRFFKSGHAWSVVNWNGQLPVWDEIILPIPAQTQSLGELFLFFDREGFSTPFLLNTRGGVFDCTGTRFLNAGHRITDARPSCDGHRLIVNGVTDKTRHLIDLEQGKVIPWHAPPGNGPDHAFVPTRSVRTKLAAIQADLNGIHLFAVHGGGLQFTRDSFGIIKVLKLEKRIRKPASAIEFHQFRSPRHLGCQLHLAQWPGGSKAFLDSRGLLHLKSHDPGVGELTLVLGDGALAAWGSDGMFTGSPFFCPGESISLANELPKRLREFVERLC